MKSFSFVSRNVKINMDLLFKHQFIHCVDKGAGMFRMIYVTCSIFPNVGVSATNVQKVEVFYAAVMKLTEN